MNNNYDCGCNKNGYTFSHEDYYDNYNNYNDYNYGEDSDRYNEGYNENIEYKYENSDNGCFKKHSCAKVYNECGCHKDCYHNDCNCHKEEKECGCHKDCGYPDKDMCEEKEVRCTCKCKIYIPPFPFRCR